MAWLDLLPSGAAVVGGWQLLGDLSEEAQVVLVPLDTGEPEFLFPGTMPRYVLGHIVYWREGALWAVPFDLERREVRRRAYAYRPGGPERPERAGELHRQ